MTRACLQVTGQPEVDPPAEEVGYAPVPPQAGTPPQQYLCRQLLKGGCACGSYSQCLGAVGDTEPTYSDPHAAARPAQARG